jgi:hypothetical protein
MSRQNKQVHFYAKRREITALHKAGQKGPKRTGVKHNKKNVKWKSAEAAQARAAILGKGHASQDKKSVLEKINETKEKVRLNKIVDQSTDE